MGNRMLLRRLSFLSLLNSSPSIRPVLHNSLTRKTRSPQVLFRNATHVSMDNVRSYHWGPISSGSVKVVMSPEGNPKFDIQITTPLVRRRQLIKYRFLKKKSKEKKKRNYASNRCPKGVIRKVITKPKFSIVEARLKDKLERAKKKEAYLIKRLKAYEVPPIQGPIVKPHELTGEELFYMKKVGQRLNNYVPVGRRGIFGGVVQNMHWHWKRHETVKVICKHCKPDQLEEYKKAITRLSGGFPIETIGNDTIVFYRGRDYRQPDEMSPIDTLSKINALTKSKFEQKLENVRHVIKLTEKELELYYRHEALYDVPNNHKPHTILEQSTSPTEWEILKDSSVADTRSQGLSTSGAGDLACLERTEVCNIDENVVKL